MAEPSALDYELLTEHFGYPPVSLLDDIINTVNVLADRALDSVEQLLLSIAPRNLGFKDAKAGNVGHTTTASEAAKLEIESGTHQLETLLNAAIDKNFDLFELYIMQNILTVKAEDQPFLRLAHYDGLDLSPQRDSLESITQLRRRLHASQKLHVALESERARNEGLLKQIRTLLGASTEGDSADKNPEGDKPLGFLRNNAELAQGGADKAITTTTEFALSQLQSLRTLSASLNALLPELASSSTEPSVDQSDRDKSWRRRRSEYIEAESRKYLERSAGLDLGPQGEVRDGEWQGPGPSVTKDEVEDLEKVASLLNTEAGS